MIRSKTVAAMCCAITSSSLAQTACIADLDGDGRVGGADLALVLSDWGACAKSVGDVTGDGVVNAGDLAAVLADWGNCEPPAWATVLAHEPDPSVIFDAELRARIVATGLPWKVRDDRTGIEMLLIPPGSFDMGCSASIAYGCEVDELPVHMVTITQPFYLSRTEVTQAQWTAEMITNPSSFQSPSAQVPASEVPNRPIERVSVNAVGGFLLATGMRLPTEAEWEYAARAGTATAFHGWAGAPMGTDDESLVAEIAWYSADWGGDAAGQTRPVGGKAANGFGLHDMAGNVSELVSDWFGSTYYASSPSRDPQGPATGERRSVRGGSWFGSPYGVRSSNRSTFPGVAVSTVGFRVARNP